MGVPVNPNRWYRWNASVMDVCISPNCERWHSSKMIDHVAAVDGVLLVASRRTELSFWIVVMMIAGVRVLELPLQDGGGRVGVGGALLESLVLAHRLVVEVLAVHHEHDLARHSGSRLASCAVLKLVSVLPEPVVCQT